MLLKIFLVCGIIYFVQSIFMGFDLLLKKKQCDSKLDLITLLPLLLPLILKDKENLKDGDK